MYVQSYTVQQSKTKEYVTNIFSNTYISTSIIGTCKQNKNIVEGVSLEKADGGGISRKSGGDSGRVLCAIHCALRRQSSVRICLIQFPFRGNAVHRSLLLSKAVSFSLCDGYNFMDLSFISCPSLFNTLYYTSDQNVVCGGSLF